jgi:hypothetical protein
MDGNCFSSESRTRRATSAKGSMATLYETQNDRTLSTEINDKEVTELAAA